MIFEPRYMVYSVSIIVALLLLAVGLVAFVAFATRDLRSAGRRRVRGAASSSSAKVIDITPLPLEIERSKNDHGAAAIAPHHASAWLVPAAGGRPIEIPFEQLRGSVVIGRGSDCAIVLDDSTVSKQHCRLDFETTGKIRINDLGSTNGTRINGLQLSSGTLRAGDRLGLGSLEFRLELHSRAAEAGGRPVKNNAAGWQLTATVEQGNVTRFVVGGGTPNRNWVIGRISEYADLVIPSPTVSAKHALLRSSPDGRLEIRDLGSSNGTVVNGRKIGGEWTAIEPSSQLRVGGCDIKVTRVDLQ